MKTRLLKLKDYVTNNVLNTKKEEFTEKFNDFFDYYNKKAGNEWRFDQIDLIRLIIDLEVKDLDIAKKILNICNVSFDYELPLGNIYLEALHQFIKHDFYDGQLEDIYSYEYEKHYITDNHLKYEWLIKDLMYNKRLNGLDLIENKKTLEQDVDKKQKTECELIYKNALVKQECSDFIYTLHLHKDRYLDTNKNISYLLYPMIDEYRAIRQNIEIYENENSRTPIDVDDLINIIVITFIDNYYEKRKESKQFRRVIEDIINDDYKKAFMGWLYTENYFSYNYFEKFYYYVFLKTSKEENDKLFYKMFTRILVNILSIDYDGNHYEIQNLTESEIIRLLHMLKNDIDRKYVNVKY